MERIQSFTDIFGTSTMSVQAGEFTLLADGTLKRAGHPDARFDAVRLIEGGGVEVMDRGTVVVIERCKEWSASMSALIADAVDGDAAGDEAAAGGEAVVLGRVEGAQDGAAGDPVEVIGRGVPNPPASEESNLVSGAFVAPAAADPVDPTTGQGEAAQ